MTGRRAVPARSTRSSSPTGILYPTQGAYGVIEMVGDIFVAGDPAEINVLTVPEPSSWLLFGIGLVFLGDVPAIAAACDRRVS